MFDFRLKVFYLVALHGSFTKAAKELGISQPAVTKHIKEIENHFNVKLFHRGSTQIYLTPPAEVLLDYAKNVFQAYQKLEFDLKALSSPIQGGLLVGASSLISQYILSALLAGFRQKLDKVDIAVQTSSSTIIEHLLLDNKIDIGLIEASSEHPDILYQDFLKDQIVLVCRANNPYLEGDLIDKSELLNLSYLFLDSDLTTQEVIEKGLKQAGIDKNKLKVEMYLDSQQSVKTYLAHCNSFAFLSKYAILKELKYKELQIVRIANLNLTRSFKIIQKKGKDNNLSDVFARFALTHQVDL
ncbi:LysR substrate-binding domain-containing protein [Myroides sp. LJL110]